MVFKATLVCLSVLLAAGLAQAGTIRIPADYPTIQAGIDAAVNGDTVLVADGVYTGTGNVNLDFKGKAITVKSENGAANCIIDCENIDDTYGFRFFSGEAATAVVEGFTIRNGKAQYGGGIICYKSSPTITNNIITGNSANNVGGGISCSASSPAITVTSLQEIRLTTQAEGLPAIMEFVRKRLWKR